MARLDTGWCVHPKILALSMAGMAVHAWSISYCDLTRSDGFIPEGVWPSKKGFAEGVKEVIKAGLWTPCEGGYHLHDFKDYNRTKAQIELAQAEDRARKAAGKPEDSGRNPNGIPRARAQTRSGDPVPVPINYLAGGPGMAGPISPETIPESGDYPGARAREDDLPDEVRATLSRPSIGRKFDRQPGMPASPSNTSQETEKYDVAVC